MTGEFAIAVHALVFLNHKNTMLSSDALAENVCTNPARVRKVMSKLKRAGIISTKEGIDGGYHMSKKAEDVDLCEISKALETDFVASGWKSGNEDMDCMVASGMAAIMDDIYGELNLLCKDRLKHISISDIDKKIFGGS